MDQVRLRVLKAALLAKINHWLGDSADLAASVAPRTYIGLSGDKDHIFPATGVAEVIADAKLVFQDLGAPAAIQAVSVSAPMAITGLKVGRPRSGLFSRIRPETHH